MNVVGVRREVYELLEAINRADSLPQIYDAAVEFICSSLHCSRAAILLLDDSGVMRFASSRGLSETYQTAVEGHCPWNADTKNPQPVWIANIDAGPLEQPMREKMRAEGIRALAFVPLTYEGRLFGKFVLYFDKPHDFTPQQVMLAQAIATQLAAAIHRRRSDEALRESEERCRAVIEQVKDYAIFSTDTEGRPTTWNEGVQRILGFKRAEFVHQDILRRIFTPEDLKEGIPEREFATAARDGASRNDRWLRRKDGSRFWAEGVTTGIRNGEGNLVGFSKVFRDSTAARVAQDQLAELKDQLDEQVQKRTESLNQALNSLETLLYTIAHDLRAPNRAMQGYADLLANAHAEQLDDEGKFFVKRIGEAALKNEALIRDLLEYGRLSHAELPCRPVDPGKIVYDVLQAFEMEILTKKAAVEVAEQWPLVMANDSALLHVITNLLTNAMKYARPRVPVRVRIFPEAVDGVDESEHKPAVRICVRDNGIGVPSDQRERIFEPFQRASNATHEGTGMGLAIVRKAAQRMGGRAGVELNGTEGSTFWIELRKPASP